MDCQNLWYCESVSPKTILILLKNFLNFWFDVVGLQSIINLGFYGSKVYALVVLCNSKVTFFVEREDTAFCPSLYCVLVIYAVSEQSSIVLVVFHQDRQLSCFYFLLELCWIYHHQKYFLFQISLWILTKSWKFS